MDRERSGSGSGWMRVLGSSREVLGAEGDPSGWPDGVGMGSCSDWGWGRAFSAFDGLRLRSDGIAAGAAVAAREAGFERVPAAPRK